MKLGKICGFLAAVSWLLLWPACAAGQTPLETSKVFAALRQVATKKQARRYTGDPITLNLVHLDLKDFLRLLHEISGRSIIVGSNVRGSVTLKLDSVPGNQLLDIVLEDNELGKTREGNVLRIATLATLEAEQKELPHIARSREEAARYTGERISVNLKDVDLKDFFRLIQEISERKVVLDPDVRGRATMVFEDIPWDQALDLVLKNNWLRKTRESDTLRISTLATLPPVQTRPRSGLGPFMLRHPCLRAASRLKR